MDARGAIALGVGGEVVGGEVVDGEVVDGEVVDGEVVGEEVQKRFAAYDQQHHQ